MQVLPVSSPGIVCYPSIISIEELMNSAHKEANIESKRTLYNSIYLQLSTSPLPGKATLLHRLFQAYATEVCYAQTINENWEAGFIKSARLMEYSLCQMLLQSSEFALFSSLEELVQYLEVNSCFTQWNQMKVDQEALVSLASNSNITSLVKEALVRLAYSYQNISELTTSTPENINIHERLNHLAEKFLDEKEAFEFDYHRAFLILLRDPAGREKWRNYYIGLIDRCKKVLSAQEAKGKEAQINNKLGLDILLNEKDFSKAKPYFTVAESSRKECLTNALPENQAVEKFLYANVISSLICCLCVEKNKEAATPLVEWLKGYVEELKSNKNDHSYNVSYATAITKYKETFSP